jgi:hypothetical protein
MNKKVKTITAKTTSKIDKREFVSSFTELNLEGLTIVQASYRSKNEIESKTTFVYDDKGKIIERVEFIEENEIAEKTCYKRNNDGKIVEALVNYSDGTFSRKSYNYQGNKLIINIVDEDGESEGTETYIFDNNENVIGKEITDYFGNTELKEVSEYDNNNNLIKKTEYDEDNDVVLINMYEYNKKDLLSIKRINGDNKTVEEISFNYDDKGRLVEHKFGSSHRVIYEHNDSTIKEMRYNSKGDVEFQSISSYNSEGLLLQEDSFFAIINYEYTYFD